MGELRATDEQGWEEGEGVVKTENETGWGAEERRGLLVMVSEFRLDVIKIGNHSSFLSEGVTGWGTGLRLGRSNEGDG